MILYISLKFHENILKVFKLLSRHENTILEFQRALTPKMYRQELRFLWSVCLLMMFYISMKFHENKRFSSYRTDKTA